MSKITTFLTYDGQAEQAANLYVSLFENSRIVEIVRTSKGRPSNLSDRERKELQALLAKVEPRELLKTVGTTGFARRFRRR